MMLKSAVAAVLGLALLAAPGVAQTAAELMQKAIYSQQSAGNLDEAIRIYRQILASSAPDRRTAAQAQYRLAQALLQKGDLDQAAREFQVLANYSEYKEVVASMAGKLPEHSGTAIVHFSNGASGSVIRHGKYSTETGRGGTYLHPSGVQLTIPPDWTILDTDPNYVLIMVGGTNGSIRVLFNPEMNLATTLAARLGMSASEPPTKGSGPQISASLGCPDSGANPVPVLAWKGLANKRNVYFVGESSVEDCRAFQKAFMSLVSTTVVP